MSTRLTYHGAASYEIVSPTHTILIDPFLSGNPLAPCGPDDLRTPDVILVSHAAVDHYGDAPAVAKRTGAPVICDAAVRAKLIDDGVRPTRSRRRRGESWSRSPGSWCGRSSATTGRWRRSPTGGP